MHLSLCFNSSTPQLQGLEEHQVSGEVEAILKDTDLEEKADTQASQLSGGQNADLSAAKKSVEAKYDDAASDAENYKK